MEQTKALQFILRTELHGDWDFLAFLVSIYIGPQYYLAFSVHQYYS